MNNRAAGDEIQSLPLLLARHVDDVCWRFEVAWKAAADGGEPPRLEAYLHAVEEPARAVLLCELLQVEAHHRHRAGDEPRGDSRSRLPDLDPSRLATVLTPDELKRTSQSPANISHRHSAKENFVPGYEMLDVLGAGGMGMVYQTRQLRLNRMVALKMIHGGLHIRPEALQRFQREAEAVAQLQHPNIVQIYEVGEHEGLPYLALEFVAGGSLDRHLGGTPQPAPVAARLVQTLALAVHHAHERGVLHRDLKPANVLLDVGQAFQPDSSDVRLESLTYAVPKITDFGLAKLLDDDAAGPTCSGDVLGTPSYMAPEQAAGKPGTTSPATDVYGLGALLYELLTGRPPFKAETALETLLQVRCAEPVSPSQLQPKCPRDLVTICLKCLHKEPRKRYASALALAEDLHRFLDGQPIQARPVGAAERALKWVRRHPAAASWLGLATAALAVLALVVVGVYRWHQQRVARDLAFGADLDRAADLRDAARWDEAGKALQQAEAGLDEGGAEEQQRHLEQARADLALAFELDRIRLNQAMIVEMIPGSESGQKGLDRTRLDRVVILPGRFNDRGTEKDYAEAFRRWELGTVGEDPEAVAARVQASAVRPRVLAALDSWAATTRDPERLAWLLDVARHVDPHPVRDRFRDPKAWRSAAAVSRLAHEAEKADLSPPQLAALALKFHRLEGDALPLLRQAQARHHQDFWLNFALADVLQVRNAPGEAVGFYWTALAIRPDTAAVYNNLGAALKGKRDLNGAITAYHKAVKLDPKAAHAHSNLGNALQAQGDLKGAIAHHRQAIECDPKLAGAHSNLGVALQVQGDLPGAIAAFRKALALDPEDANTHINLGNTLKAKGDAEGAIAAYHKAIDCDPESALAYYNLGIALKDQRDLDGAIAAYRKAIELNPRDAQAHYNLGNMLRARGNLAGAIAAYRKAIECAPKFTSAHNNLGSALKTQGDLDGAIAAYRKAIESDPKHAVAHNNLGTVLEARNDLAGAIACYRNAVAVNPQFATAHTCLGNALLAQGGKVDEAIACYRAAIKADPTYADGHFCLGSVLLSEGRFADALGPLKQGHALGSKRPDWRYPSDRSVRQCESLLALDSTLAAVLKGAPVASTTERVQLAWLCRQPFKGLHRTSVRLYGDAFAAEPKLAEDLQAQHRYNAACAAALAATGKGTDASKLDDRERARLMQQALDWLRADVDAYARLAEKGNAKARQVIHQRLAHWQQDMDLAALRDAKALPVLPERERTLWENLWADVAALRKKLETK